MVQQKIDSTNVTNKSEFKNYEIINKTDLNETVLYRNFIFKKDKQSYYIIKKGDLVNSPFNSCYIEYKDLNINNIMVSVDKNLELLIMMQKRIVLGH